ncbi:hypothetical protein ACOME3_010241 [Neoechinorhynchus agilis]
MFLSQNEMGNLTLHNAGFLAQRRLARGVRLNYKEAVALLTSQCLEYIREGIEDDAMLADSVRRLLGYRQVMTGVPSMIRELSFVADFQCGTRPIVITNPICSLNGDLAMALMGSFLPEPDLDLFGSVGDEKTDPPGNIEIHDNSDIDLNPNKLETRTVTVVNSSDSKIIVGSHFHFIEVNKALQFDRSVAYGMRLSIPAGTSFEFPACFAIGGERIVRGGNWVCDGPLTDEALKKSIKNMRKRGFSHKLSNESQERPPGAVMPRSIYVQQYGPTTGDLIKLGDTNLFVEVEHDLTVHGDEAVHGIGKVIREGMGQMANARNDRALDTVITNVVIIDAVLGVIKADIGIREGLIVNIGNAGNPHTMEHVTDGLIIGLGTNIISGEGLLATAGSVVIANVGPGGNVCEQCAKCGITTLFVLGGGGGGNICLSGPGAVKSVLQSTDNYPLNVGCIVRSGASKSEGLAKEVEDCLVAGAAALVVNEHFGSSRAAVDSALRCAEYHDVPLICCTDPWNESYTANEELMDILKDRPIIMPIDCFRTHVGGFNNWYDCRHRRTLHGW